MTLKEVPNRVIASYAFPGVFSTPDMARQYAATLRQMLVNDQLMTLNEGNHKIQKNEIQNNFSIIFL